jgi:histidinol-phosphate/aromatic aminotransferase/cobyric acid decarboxylase-like protein
MIPPAGDHGGDGARVAAALGIDVADVLDLSASLNPYAPDVTELAERHLSSLRRYPDVEQAEGQLAKAVGVEPERLVLTAGGAQAIALVADHLGKGWVEEPDFSLYRRHLPVLDPHALRWRSDPHNPSGLLTSRDDEAVWDEAFLPLSAGTWTRGRPGWSLGSLTKAFACPGLRLGYAIAPTPDDAAELRQRRPAWAVGGLACALLPELLDRADLPGWTERIATARSATHEVLAKHGFRPEPSDAPWLLVPDSAGLRERLAPQAVVVRDCSSFGLCNYSRIAIPGESGIERLDSALAASGGFGGRNQDEPTRGETSGHV